MVRGDDVVAEPLAELVGQALGEPAGVHEHERGVVLAHELGDPVEHVVHLLGRGDRLELAVGQLEREVEVALVAGVDDRRQRTVADEQPRHRLDRALRRRQPDAARARPRTSASSRSRVSARCAPRLSRATAWISSTITVSTVRSIARPFSPVTSR